MTSNQSIWDKDKKTLKNFGLILSSILGFVFGLIIPWAYNIAWPIWPWIVTAVVLLVSFVMPILLLPVFVALSFISLRVGKLVNWIVLSAVFCLLVLPTSLVLRLLRRDVLQQYFDRKTSSYLIRSGQVDIKHMEKPY